MKLQRKKEPLFRIKEKYYLIYQHYIPILIIALLVSIAGVYFTSKLTLRVTSPNFSRTADTDGSLSSPSSRGGADNTK